MRMGPWNQSYGRSSKGIKCKSLCDDTEGGRSLESMVRWTTQDRTNSGIEITICSTLFLYSKERQFIMIGPELQKAQPGHNKGQNTITSDQRGDR